MVVSACANQIGGSVAMFRMKRVDSILGKIRREGTHFDLPTLDDVGGCRLIVDTVSDVERAIELIKAGFVEKYGKDVEIHENNYILEPKKSGYRCHHLRIRFPRCEGPNRVEIQVRTKLQHTWATTVEIFDEANGSSIKSPVGNEEETPLIRDVKTLLEIASSLFALEEGRPVVPGTSSDRTELLASLRRIENLDQVLAQLDQESGVLDSVVGVGGQRAGDVHILRFFREEQVLIVESYTLDQLQQALRQYDYYEQLATEVAKHDADDVEQENVVLVQCSTKELPTAYPNYSYSGRARQFLEKFRGYLNEAR